MSKDLHTMDDWRQDVANGDTTLGYQEWLTKQLEADIDSKPASDEPVLRTYGIRLWATFRAVSETEIDAISFEEAMKEAALLDHNDFHFTIEDGIEGDESISVFGPSDDDVDDEETWGGDGVQIDKRTDGEPWGWEAAELVKDLAKLDMSSTDAFHKAGGWELVSTFVNRAKAACRTTAPEDEGTTNGD